MIRTYVIGSFSYFIMNIINMKQSKVPKPFEEAISLTGMYRHEIESFFIILFNSIHWGKNKLITSFILLFCQTFPNTDFRTIAFPKVFAY